MKKLYLNVTSFCLISRPCLTYRINYLYVILFIYFTIIYVHYRFDSLESIHLALFVFSRAVVLPSTRDKRSFYSYS